MPASLELVKLAVQAYGDRYCEIALGMADPLIRWDERASRPDGELVWKRDAVQKAMRRYLDSWESYSFELEDVAEVSPGKVVGICRESGVDATGTPVDRRFGGLWVVEGGKIVPWSTYLTPREAVRAAKAARQPEPAIGRRRWPMAQRLGSTGSRRARRRRGREGPGEAERQDQAAGRRLARRPGPRPRSARPRSGSCRRGRPSPRGLPSSPRRCRMSRR